MLWIEFVEFKGVDRTPLRMRIQDRGAARLQLRAQNIDALVARIKDAGMKSRRGGSDSAQPQGRARCRPEQLLPDAVCALRRLCTGITGARPQVSKPPASASGFRLQAEETREAADLLWDCWNQGRRLTAIPDEIRPRTREEGYAVQALLEQRSAAPLFGWKIAATSKVGQTHINVDRARWRDGFLRRR